MTTAGDTYRSSFIDLAAAYYKINREQAKRIKQLEQLCRDLYRIAAHEGYIGNELHDRLVELGFAEGEQE